MELVFNNSMRGIRILIEKSSRIIEDQYARLPIPNQLLIFSILLSSQFVSRKDLAVTIRHRTITADTVNMRQSLSIEKPRKKAFFSSDRCRRLRIKPRTPSVQIKKRVVLTKRTFESIFLIGGFMCKHVFAPKKNSTVLDIISMVEVHGMCSSLKRF